MIDLEQFIQKLRQDFIDDHPGGPDLNLKWKSLGRGEGYSLSYAGGKATIDAESPLAAIFGLSLLRTALASGHLAEYLGDHTPKLSLRPLWIKSLRDKNRFVDYRSVEKLCQRILLLGYNTIILDLSDVAGISHSITSKAGKEQKDAFASLENILNRIKAYGISVSIRLKSAPSQALSLFDEDYAEHIKKILLPVTKWSENIDYLFWESTIYQQEVYQHHNARDLLQLDLARWEIEKLEDQLDGKCRLIYSIPTLDSHVSEKQSCWIPTLCNEISENTVLAFSSHAGDPCLDYLPPHPLWEKLRAAKLCSYSNLLPIVNIGLVNHGEGLWPTLTLDQINRYLVRCNNSSFCGAIAMTSHLPKEDALLSCNLWAASQTLWGNSPANLLIGTWFSAFRPEFLLNKDLEKSLDEIREISVKVGQLTSYMTEKRQELSKDEYRTLTDSLLSRLRCLQASIKNQEVKSSEKPNLKDYFLFFVRDARRLILRFLQHYQMPMVSVLDGDDMKESFWTEVSNPNPQGLTSGVEVFLLKEPRKGESNSPMAKIYEEVIN